MVAGADLRAARAGARGRRVAGRRPDVWAANAAPISARKWARSRAAAAAAGHRRAPTRCATPTDGRAPGARLINIINCVTCAPAGADSRRARARHARPAWLCNQGRARGAGSSGAPLIKFGPRRVHLLLAQQLRANARAARWRRRCAPAEGLGGAGRYVTFAQNPTTGADKQRAIEPGARQMRAWRLSLLSIGCARAPLLAPGGGRPAARAQGQRPRACAPPGARAPRNKVNKHVPVGGHHYLAPNWPTAWRRRVTVGVQRRARLVSGQTSRWARGSGGRAPVWARPLSAAC